MTTVCLVGLLMGDAWMALPPVLALPGPVNLIVGSYALPVWEWARNHIADVNFEIIRVVEDPEDANHPFCPGKGFYSISAALEMIRKEMAGTDVLGVVDIGSCYRKAPPALDLDFEVFDGEAVVLHPRTSHSWKNLDKALQAMQFHRPVRVVGFKNEWPLRNGYQFVDGFDNQVRETLQAHCVVGVLSSFTNLASLFSKRQIVLSFTGDAALAENPRAHVLVNPEPSQARELALEWQL